MSHVFFLLVSLISRCISRYRPTAIREGERGNTKRPLEMHPELQHPGLTIGADYAEDPFPLMKTDSERHPLLGSMHTLLKDLLGLIITAWFNDYVITNISFCFTLVLNIIRKSGALRVLK